MSKAIVGGAVAVVVIVAIVGSFILFVARQSEEEWYIEYYNTTRCEDNMCQCIGSIHVPKDTSSHEAQAIVSLALRKIAIQNVSWEIRADTIEIGYSPPHVTFVFWYELHT